jgi:hypothetical protein
MSLQPGAVYRITGHRGLYRAVEPAADKTGRAWWFLPCDKAGTWNRTGGNRAFHPDRATPLTSRT